jgi:hypothetical protein
MTSNGTGRDPAYAKLGDSLKHQLAFQKRWQRLSMLAYVSSTVGILFCSTAATVCAARQLSELASYFAAAATILVGLEKSMLFREKWRFHLGMATQLSVLAAQLDAGPVDVTKIVNDYSAILKSYASSLPIAARESA